MSGIIRRMTKKDLIRRIAALEERIYVLETRQSPESYFPKHKLLGGIEIAVYKKPDAPST